MTEPDKQLKYSIDVISTRRFTNLLIHIPQRYHRRVIWGSIAVFTIIVPWLTGQVYSWYLGPIVAWIILNTNLSAVIRWWNKEYDNSLMWWNKYLDTDPHGWWLVKDSGGLPVAAAVSKRVAVELVYGLHDSYKFWAKFTKPKR